MSMDELVPELAEAIERRRRELGLTVGDLARITGLTRQGLAPLREGRRRAYQERLTLPVAKALGWQPDAIERLLQGLQPVEIDPAAPEADPTDVTQLRAELERATAAIAEMQLRLHTLEVLAHVHD